MIQFQRPDDNGMIHINPHYVAAVFSSRYDDVDITIIRMNDGRGLKVLGTLQETMAKLTGQDALMITGEPN